MASPRSWLGIVSSKRWVGTWQKNGVLAFQGKGTSRTKVSRTRDPSVKHQLFMDKMDEVSGHLLLGKEKRHLTDYQKDGHNDISTPVLCKVLQRRASSILADTVKGALPEPSVEGWGGAWLSLVIREGLSKEATFKLRSDQLVRHTRVDRESISVLGKSTC